MPTKILNRQETLKYISENNTEFAVVDNPEYIYSPCEIYPLAPVPSGPVEKIVGVVMDMDGTTTTTEDLCIHSLEYMVRKMSGLMTGENWTGLDEEEDYPNIIGNSTTKHVEFLINKYKDRFKAEEIRNSFIYAALWTIVNGKDELRKVEAETNLDYFGLGEMIDDPAAELRDREEIDDTELKKISAVLTKKYFKVTAGLQTDDLVRIGIEIYYQRYHEILGQITAGSGSEVADELFSDPSHLLIRPMEGIGIFIALVKGWLEDEIEKLFPVLLNEYEIKKGEAFNFSDEIGIKERLVNLGRMFKITPAGISIVTSSIFYEANIVMQEVFKVLSEKVSDWPISEEKKIHIKEKFSDYRNVYDAFVTASDSSEIRLKPHRDLYSIALHRLGIKKDDFRYVAGFEDSESGIVAIRAAGVGLSVSLPFAETSRHSFKAAAHTVRGGLPEVLLNKNLFVKY